MINFMNQFILLRFPVVEELEGRKASWQQASTFSMILIRQQFSLPKDLYVVDFFRHETKVELTYKLTENNQH